MPSGWEIDLAAPSVASVPVVDLGAITMVGVLGAYIQETINFREFLVVIGIWTQVCKIQNIYCAHTLRTRPLTYYKIYQHFGT